MLSKAIRECFPSYQAVLTGFMERRSLTPEGAKGTLIFTGATASLRGNTTTALLATGKHAIRALSQSLNKEFGKENIHVCEAIIDGWIYNDHTKEILAGRGIGESDTDKILIPETIAENYLYLAHQKRSAWTWELDCPSFLSCFESSLTVADSEART